MAGRLDGRVAIVTGAGRGIGRGEALLLAQEGAAVVVNDVGVETNGESPSTRPADDVVAEIRAAGGRAVANYDPVGTLETAEKIVNTALDNFHRLDIVVNNAAILRDRMLINMTQDEWDAVIGVHLTGTWSLCRAATPVFRERQWGRIVNTSSRSGTFGNIGQANYVAAKEGIVGLTRAVARELGRYGVTANAIRPSAGTRMTLSDAMWASAEKAAKMGQPLKMQHLSKTATLKPEWVAPLVVWLCTEEAANVNGRVFYDGGRVGLYAEPEISRTLISPKGYFTVDELAELMPEITGDLVNTSPPEVRAPI